MTRSEFSPSVRVQAWDRCKGRCEKCGCKLYPGHFAYDHKQPDGLGGAPVLENCQVLCDNCHSEKTHEQDRPIMQKADNQKKAILGIKSRGARPMPGTKASGLKKRFDGTVERRSKPPARDFLP